MFAKCDRYGFRKGKFVKFRLDEAGYVKMFVEAGDVKVELYLEAWELRYSRSHLGRDYDAVKDPRVEVCLDWDDGDWGPADGPTGLQVQGGNVNVLIPHDAGLEVQAAIEECLREIDATTAA